MHALSTPPPASDLPWLLADIGGTHARFAVLLEREGVPQHIEAYRTADFPSPASAVERYLIAHKLETHAASFAVAGPVGGDRIKLTNEKWEFSISDLKRQFRWKRMLCLNDFEALALSLPGLRIKDRKSIGKTLLSAEYGRVDLHPNMAVLGPGTGLGVAGLIHHHHRWLPIAGEGGHINFAPTQEEEIEIWRILTKKYDHVSQERVLSGSGLKNLYEALATIRKHPLEERSPEEITEKGLSGECPICEQALTRFSSILGSFAGDVALTFGAKGGVFIGGGIAPRLLDFLQRSPFRKQFEAKGRHKDFLRTIPTYVITAPYAAFSGAARALAEEAVGSR